MSREGIDWRWTTYRDDNGDPIPELRAWCESCGVDLGWHAVGRGYADAPPRFCSKCVASRNPPPAEEPPIERVLRERAGFLTGCALVPAAALLTAAAVNAVAGRAEAGAFLAMGVMSAMLALLPGWFLLKRYRGRR